MAHSLEYHQSIFDLLGISAVPSLDRLARIEERERICQASFPASVREWFAIESAESLFYEKSNNDGQTKLEELGDRAEVAQSYLRVATENQAVVAWYVRLNEGEDPPVYDNNDEWNEDLSKTSWRRLSETFTNFIFDMLSMNDFGGWYSGMHLSAKDRMPDAQALGLLREAFRQGPTTDVPNCNCYRFFNQHGIITVRSGSPEDLADAGAKWSIEADSPDALLQFAQKVWQIGTLSQTLKAESCSRESREEGDKVLRRLRGCSQQRGGKTRSSKTWWEFWK